MIPSLSYASLTSPQMFHAVTRKKDRVVWSNNAPARGPSLMRIVIRLFATALLCCCCTGCVAADSPMAEAAITEESVVLFLNRFEDIAGAKKFDLIEHMIHDDGVFRFNDGDFVGKQAIRGAFEKTWAGSAKVESERFYLTDIQVVTSNASSATATYTYNWEGSVSGQTFQIKGRGTRVIVLEQGRMQIILEHLSANPGQ